MPIPIVTRDPLPFYAPRVTPDTSRLQQIYANSGAQLSNLALQRGNAQADTLTRLAAIISNGIGDYRTDQTRKKALAQSAAEKEADRKEREAERKQIEADKAAERADRQRDQERGAARYAVDKATPGPQSPALYALAQQFPETAARFRVQAPLPATVTPGAAGEVAPAEGNEYPVLDPTDEQVQQQGLRQLQRERYAAEDKARADAAAARAVDDQRQSLMLNETMRHNRATEAAAVVKAGDGAGAVQMSPETIETAAHRVMLFGPGAIPTRFNDNDKKRILNREAEINKAIGNTPAAAAMRAAVQKADQGALNKITAQAASAEAFENKALQQADLVKELSGKVDRTAFPIINGALVSGKAALGDTPAHLLANALLTYTSEYAKIVEGSTGSAAGSSDAARRAAGELITKALSKGTLAATVDQMNREMGMTRTGYQIARDDITSRMGGGAAPSAPAAPAPASGGGFIEAIDPQGVVHHAPAGTPLPAGWRLK